MVKLSVKEYLEVNVQFHSDYPGHSYPCGLWTSPKQGAGVFSSSQREKWESLMQHGLIHRCMILIDVEFKDGKESK